jgi:DNA-binding transcriptional MerR regulator
MVVSGLTWPLGRGGWYYWRGHWAPGFGRDDVGNEWLSPGAFSRESRLSSKALRLYARDGLLVPGRIDPQTGYRQYHVDQLHSARLIRLLRRAGLPLALVAGVVGSPVDKRQALVDAFWVQTEREFAYRRDLIAHLSRTLSGAKESYPMYEINVREVGEQTVLTEQAYVTAPGLTEWIVAAGLRQLEAANAVGGQTGARLVIYHGEVSEDSDGPVEEATPISPDRATDAMVATRVEPAHREAYVTVTRAQVRYPDILSAYDAVERWITENHGAIAGPPREAYFADPSEGPDDDPVADIAYPIQ